LAGGFQADKVYQLIDKATKSPVMGLGYATNPRFRSFLRYETADDHGNPNPVPELTTFIEQGISQGGYYLRDWLYQGFNENEQGQPVFDGVYIVRPGVLKLFLNARFAQPSPSSWQHSGRYLPDTNFPLARHPILAKQRRSSKETLAYL
jgi:hypothetical protein